MTCLACETIFWQRSIEDYMKSCFKEILLIHPAGGFVSVHGEK